MFPFDRYAFRVVVLEHNFEEPKRSAVRELLEAKGYAWRGGVLFDDLFEWAPSPGGQPGAGGAGAAASSAPVGPGANNAAAARGGEVESGLLGPCPAMGDAIRPCWGYRHGTEVDEAARFTGAALL